MECHYPYESNCDSLILLTASNFFILTEHFIHVYIYIIWNTKFLYCYLVMPLWIQLLTDSIYASPPDFKFCGNTIATKLGLDHVLSNTVKELTLTTIQTHLFLVQTSKKNPSSSYLSIKLLEKATKRSKMCWDTHWNHDYFTCWGERPHFTALCDNDNDVMVTMTFYSSAGELEISSPWSKVVKLISTVETLKKH